MNDFDVTKKNNHEKFKKLGPIQTRLSNTKHYCPNKSLPQAN